MDVAFDPQKLPKPLDAITIVDKARGINVTIEAALHIGDNIVRCISMSSTDGLVRGMPATDTGGPISVPVGEAGLGRIFNLLGEPIDGKGPVKAETKSAVARPWNRGFLGYSVTVDRQPKLNTPPTRFDRAGTSLDDGSS